MNPERFYAITQAYARLRLGVVGDFCLDRYLEIDPAKAEVSIETGLPVYNVTRVRSQPGGAGTILNNLAEKVDQLIVGGGIANTFLLASGVSIGKSLAEPDLIPECRRVIETLQRKGATLPLPIDVVVAKQFSADAPAQLRRSDDVQADDLILDVGPQTSAHLSRLVQDAGTIIWNGPLGVFEFDAFAQGTHDLALAVASATARGAFSIAGGGDTLAAIAKYKISDRVSYISTGGGAFLEFLEGKPLPAVAVLQERAAS